MIRVNWKHLGTLVNIFKILKQENDILWLVYYIKEHTFNSLFLWLLTVDFLLDQQEPACAFCLPRVNFDIALRTEKRVPTPETHTLILWSTYFVFGKWKVTGFGSWRLFFVSVTSLCQTPKLWSDSINKTFTSSAILWCTQTHCPSQKASSLKKKKKNGWSHDISIVLFSSQYLFEVHQEEAVN